MLKGKTIFILSLMKFDGLASSNFTIAKYLAKDNEVYYIEHPLTIKDFFNLDRDSDTYKTRSSGFNIGSSGMLHDKIDGVNIIVSLPVLPFNGIKNKFLYKTVNRLNETLTASRVKKIIKGRKLRDFVFINAYDFKYPNFHKILRPALSVYYCVDPIPEYDRLYGLENEKQIINEVDVVICTSRELYEEKRLVNSNTYFVPNGSDIVLKRSSINVGAYNGLDSLPGPVVGYIGAIERRMDYDLIDEVSTLLADVNFVFIGPCNKEFIPNWFFKKDNIHVLDPVFYDQVPAVINSFDVCIIPFRKDDISRSIFPLKLFEYLGMGKPVVVSDFNPDLKEFTEDTVCFAEDALSFVTGIKEGIENKEANVQKRIDIALQNTWKDRAERISRIINDGLNSR